MRAHRQRFLLLLIRGGRWHHMTMGRLPYALLGALPAGCAANTQSARVAEARQRLLVPLACHVLVCRSPIRCPVHITPGRARAHQDGDGTSDSGEQREEVDPVIADAYRPSPLSGCTFPALPRLSRVSGSRSDAARPQARPARCPLRNAAAVGTPAGLRDLASHRAGAAGLARLRAGDLSPSRCPGGQGRGRRPSWRSA